LAWVNKIAHWIALGEVEFRISQETHTQEIDEREASKERLMSADTEAEEEISSD
jgi:hypothetical protein